MYRRICTVYYLNKSYVDGIIDETEWCSRFSSFVCFARQSPCAVAMLTRGVAWSFRNKSCFIMFQHAHATPSEAPPAC